MLCLFQFCFKRLNFSFFFFQTKIIENFFYQQVSNGTPITVGKTALGASSPPNPAFTNFD
jgi:hypothetical protein